MDSSSVSIWLLCPLSVIIWCLHLDCVFYNRLKKNLYLRVCIIDLVVYPLWDDEWRKGCGGLKRAYPLTYYNFRVVSIFTQNRREKCRLGCGVLGLPGQTLTFTICMYMIYLPPSIANGRPFYTRPHIYVYLRPGVICSCL